MVNQIELTQRGKKLTARTAREVGMSCYIAIPKDCLGQKYARYIDTLTGVITLIPEAFDAEKQREEN